MCKHKVGGLLPEQDKHLFIFYSSFFEKFEGYSQKVVTQTQILKSFPGLLLLIFYKVDFQTIAFWTRENPAWYCNNNRMYQLFVRFKINTYWSHLEDEARCSNTQLSHYIGQQNFGQRWRKWCSKNNFSWRKVEE